jgi:hypothetical protein
LATRRRQAQQPFPPRLARTYFVRNLAQAPAMLVGYDQTFYNVPPLLLA